MVADKNCSFISVDSSICKTLLLHATYEMFNSEKTKNQEKQITRRMRPLNGNCFVGRASQVVIYRFYFLLFYLQNDLVLCDNPPSLYSFLALFQIISSPLPNY